MAALGAHADEPHAIALLSDGGSERGRWSYFACEPAAVLRIAPEDAGEPIAALTALLGPRRCAAPDGPPFQGGVAGLAAYELADRFDPLGLARRPNWPDLACARYERLLAFDHDAREVLAIGPDAQAAKSALNWLGAPSPAPPRGPLAADPQPDSGAAHEVVVADVVARIAAGEIFQANLARAWRGELAPGRRPYDLLARLAERSPAPFAGYLRLSGLALVSNSPERFLRVSAEGDIETRPIKGTVPRGATCEEDARLVAALAASPKDRAENLMIVDLMRNDLARVAAPGSVRVPALFAVERYANVSHLVSTVTATLEAGRTALDALAAAFPPGSITGAPKLQAMRVIAGLEPSRGPFYGSLFWAGFDGALDSSVLIRTTAFEQAGSGWRFEARAGGGIVADSDPGDERRETEAKIAAILAALRTDGEVSPSRREQAGK